MLCVEPISAEFHFWKILVFWCLKYIDVKNFVVELSAGFGVADTPDSGTNSKIDCKYLRFNLIQEWRD
jgi:hypothetical protein